MRRGVRGRSSPATVGAGRRFLLRMGICHDLLGSHDNGRKVTVALFRLYPSVLLVTLNASASSDSVQWCRLIPGL